MVVVAYWKKVNSEAGISRIGVTLATVALAWSKMDLSTPSPSSDDITTQVQEVSICRVPSLSVKMETRGLMSPYPSLLHPRRSPFSWAIYQCTGSNERCLTRTDKRSLKVGPAV